MPIRIVVTVCYGRLLVTDGTENAVKIMVKTQILLWKTIWRRAVEKRNVKISNKQSMT